jgi:hypothetical protein
MPFAVGMQTDGPLEIVPQEEWPDEIKAAEADELKYNGERSSARLFVELPFWLMTPPAAFSLNFDKSFVPVHIHDDFIEVGHLNRFLDSRANLQYIGPAEAATAAKCVHGLRGTVLRPQKTVLEFEVKALREALLNSQLSSPDAHLTPRERRSRTRRINRATHYFETLAIAHLPFVNRLITAYRAASQDPFAFDVSTWDIPLWWLISGDLLIRINLMPYKDSDDYPTVTSLTTGERRPYFAATADSLSEQLSHPVSPSYKELLDAKSLLYRGRYNDAVRAVVTSIEVEIEAQLRQLYINRGDTNDDIHRRLNESKLSFMDRVDEWEQLNHKRLPGPKVAEYPHLNGLRLKSELVRTRSLRHKIVHEGYHIDAFSKGEAYRAVDTMTWLHEWLTNRHKYTDQQRDNGNLFSATFGMTFVFNLLPFEYEPEGVVVKSPMHDSEQTLTTEEALARQFASVIEPVKWTPDAGQGAGRI